MIRFYRFIALIPVVLAAQVTVHINSGNPVYPFPQFQPYENNSGKLDNLATRNPQGVSHAEMEQAIRDAYQVQMNRASKQSGSVGGKSYIRYASNPQCSEGDGYGLLGAAAMADKETFDGMWLYIHDVTLNKVKRYSDCKAGSPGYAYSQLPGWMGAGTNSAADGDFDIALALLIAYKQWGEKMGIKDACGNDISYKQAAIDFLTALTDSMTYAASGSGLLSGDIGLDGYMKGGDSWGEMTAWAGNKATTGFTKPAQDPGPKTQHFDYAAPAYFTQFADFLSWEDSSKYAWNIYQFRRAAASSDWIMGKLLDNPAYIPFAGDVTLSAANQPTFVAYSDGEDFRLAWRTILSYIWHGNPTSTWDPVAHQVVGGTPNSFERDIGLRYAKFLWDTRQDPWNNSCEKVSNSTFEYWGPSVIKYRYSLTGEPTATFVLNWVPGTGSPSAVASQDFNLMAELYRTCETTWDAETPGDGYLTSVPHYFHGWFRLLGMLVLTGNYQSPSTLKPAANCKVYCGIDKTFAFERDTVTYTLDYRNYGSVDAAGVTIIDTLHQDFEFVSATGGGLYNNTSHTVFWNIGSIPGVKSDTDLKTTRGQVQFKVMIRTANEKQYRNRAVISCSNGTGWISNEYPNSMTAVMQRNYLDIARRALICDYKASKDLVKPGETVEFTIDFQNSSEAGWINGGRSGVRFSFSMGDATTVGDAKEMRFRLFHDAQEAYIDYGNYRVSYFMFDSVRTCYQGATGCTNGWDITPFFYEGLAQADVKVLHENIVPGEDKRGKWNQRIILQFSDPLDPKRTEHLSTLDYLLRQYYGNSGSNIHKGGGAPLRLSWSLHTNYSPPQATWSQNWSWDAASVDVAGGMYWPVTNDWTDPDNPDQPIDRWHPKSCSKASHTVNNILVEEWDGYTWRRVAGNGPMPGREVNNVIIRDTIPDGFTFVAFTGNNPLGVAPTVSGKVVSWSIPKMQIRQGGTIKFTAVADGTCPAFTDLQTVNRVWISADKESAFADSSEIAVSCDTVIKPLPADHIDIVLDTLLLDLNKDADFVRISMDEGTLGAVAYAVARDKNGKFIRKVTGGLWASRDNTIVTAAAASATSWQGIITKVSGGPVVVVVTDPADPALKPDSIAITAVETPPWPAISLAIMGDATGDIIPDMVTLTLNDTFHVNQQFDSVAIDYRGTRYSFKNGAVTLAGKSVAFPVPGLTIADPQPTGTVTMFITVDGSVKQVTKELSDGVGPALAAVTLTMDASGAMYDTLNLTFTEDVAMPTLIGATLLLIRSATGDTVVLPVIDYRGPDIYKETKAAVFNASGIRPSEGDFVRLVPGSAGGTLADKKKNLPHLLNAAVQIPERPAQLADSWYADENADGILDAVYLKFYKPVDAAGLVVSVSWNSSRFDALGGADLTSGDDKSLVRVQLPIEPMAQGGVKTGGAMFVQARFTAYVDEERSAQVRDGAAPVIKSAFYKVGMSSSAEMTAVDTFVVDFSEPVTIADVAVPFLLVSKGGVDYKLLLQLSGVTGERAVFLVQSIQGVQYPESGDVVSINPVSAVKDSAIFQNDPANRKVAFMVMRGAVQWDVIAVPNPFDPALPAYDSGATAIRIVSPLNKAIPLTFESAHISIYDAVGNVVVANGKFVQTPAGPVFYWSGANRKRRIVGNGTYIGVVTVDDKESHGTKRVKVGVRRGASAAK